MPDGPGKVQSIEPTCGREFEYEDEFEYDYGNDCEEGGLSPRTRISPVSKRSTSRVSIATMRWSISLPGRTRSFETKRFATEASRQAAHSMAEPRASSKNLAL